MISGKWVFSCFVLNKHKCSPSKLLGTAEGPALPELLLEGVERGHVLLTTGTNLILHSATDCPVQNRRGVRVVMYSIQKNSLDHLLHTEEQLESCSPYRRIVWITYSIQKNSLNRVVHTEEQFESCSSYRSIVWIMQFIQKHSLDHVLHTEEQFGSCSPYRSIVWIMQFIQKNSLDHVLLSNESFGSCTVLHTEEQILSYEKFKGTVQRDFRPQFLFFII